MEAFDHHVRVMRIRRQAFNKRYRGRIGDPLAARSNASGGYTRTAGVDVALSTEADEAVSVDYILGEYLDVMLDVFAEPLLKASVGAIAADMINEPSVESASVKHWPR